MTRKNNQSLVLIKPDGLVKSLTGNILTRLSETKLRIVGAKVVKVTRELAEEHYAHLKDKPFFNAVADYMMGKIYAKEYERVIAIVYAGEGAIDKIRKMAGATNPEEADQTSIRGQYGRVTTKGIFENVIHCSANEEDAEREIKLWFKPDELIEEVYASEEVEVKVKKRIWK
ncbi:MAG: nucleoside-diphosphate kinase [Elusimicrobia bacterium RIFOXYB2_FULL_48_7]|nr:MAG: nucleoside-diphosphate kinase [Elusimicrobia bacterium RIFOXYB2_FULL_48_7]